MLECKGGCCSIVLSEYTPAYERYRNKPKNKSGVFIYDPIEDRVLLVQSRANLWGIPKGSIEEGETTLECALREVREETGLKLEEEALITATRIRNRALYYYTEMPACKVNIQREIGNDVNGIGWVRLECLKDYVRDGEIMLNKHCKILLKRFLGRDFFT